MAIKDHPAFILLRNYCKNNTLNPADLTKAEIVAVVRAEHTDDYLLNIRNHCIRARKLYLREAKRLRLETAAQAIFGNDAAVTLKPQTLVVWPNGVPELEVV